MLELKTVDVTTGAAQETVTVVGTEAATLVPATTVTVAGSVTPEGMDSCPPAVRDELLQPDGGPDGPHDHMHPLLGQFDAVSCTDVLGTDALACTTGAAGQVAPCDQGRDSR